MNSKQFSKLKYWTTKYMFNFLQLIGLNGLNISFLYILSKNTDSLKEINFHKIMVYILYGKLILSLISLL